MLAERTNARLTRVSTTGVWSHKHHCNTMVSNIRVASVRYSVLVFHVLVVMAMRRRLGDGRLSVRCGIFGVLPLGVESQGTLLPPSRLHTTRQGSCSRLELAMTSSPLCKVILQPWNCNSDPPNAPGYLSDVCFCSRAW